jgi:hypothetical protein
MATAQKPATTTAPKYDGRTIRMGGTEYIIPAITLAHLKKHRATIVAIGNPKDGNPLEKMADALPVITDAFKRNYPDMDADAISDLIDMGNFPHVWMAVLGLDEEQSKKALANPQVKPGE